MKEKTRMPNFRKGAQVIAQSGQKRESGTPRPNFVNWEPDEKKYIQFITPLEEIPTVLMHQFIITGERDNGSYVYNDFVSRKDPAFDGEDGYDPIWDRFEVQPRLKSVALAAVLQPKRSAGKITGWELASKARRDDTIDDIGLIVQTPANFFRWLTTFADDTGNAIEDCVFSVTRRGEKISTRYDFVKTEHPAIDLSAYAENFPDVEAYLGGLGDEDRLRSLIDPLPDTAMVSRYGGKNTTETNSQSDADAEHSTPWQEPDEAAPRNTRFAALKQKMETE
jgi:hypothetical protein